MLCKFHSTLICGVFILCFLSVIIAADETDKKNSVHNDTKDETKVDPKTNDPVFTTTTHSFKDLFNENREMLKRVMYVTIAVSAILILYFGIRFVRARRRRARRYGRLRASNNDKMEMDRLASESEDDVVFDAKRSLVQ